MVIQNQISGLCKLGTYICEFLQKNPEDFNEDDYEFEQILRKSEIENSWFTEESQKFALREWSSLLTEEKITKWLDDYETAKFPKKVALVLAGNIPLVGFHDVISVVLSGNIPVIKLSSKDTYLIPFLMRKWNIFAGQSVPYELVDKIQNFDAVIATGSNNTAKYMEHYFQNSLSIIRKNRTSIAVLQGDESNAELQRLAEDIFRYYGMGCRNVTRLFIPTHFPLEKLFENFSFFSDIINHHKYANNYEYNRAIYLLNQDPFWDNNFVMLKEDDRLFSPLAVLHFSRYENLEEVQRFIELHQEDIQCIVAPPKLGIQNSVYFGEAQKPALNTYADHVDTMKFLEVI